MIHKHLNDDVGHILCNTEHNNLEHMLCKVWRVPLLVDVHVVQHGLQHLPHRCEGRVADELAQCVLGDLERRLGLLVCHCAEVGGLASTLTSLNKDFDANRTVYKKKSKLGQITLEKI